MAAGPETELRFRIAEQNFPKISATLLAEGGRQGQTARLHAVYYDTPALDLWRNGFSLRVREVNGRFFQAIKRGSPSALEREEHEAEVEGPGLDFEHIGASPLASLSRSQALHQLLRPLFETDIERSSYLFTGSGSLIEVSLDRGLISANGEAAQVSELELELRQGGLAALFALGRLLASRAPLHLSFISKAERGYLLAQGEFGRAMKSSKPCLQKGIPASEAFKEICRTCLHDFDLNMLALRGSDTAEAVHQGRIALRRLRAALALFKPVARDMAHEKLGQELKWTARLLGTVRDLDVLEANLARAIPPGPSAVRTQAQGSGGERRRALKEALDAMESGRGRALLFDLKEWIEEGQWQRQPLPKAGEPMETFARARLKDKWKRLVKRGAHLEELDPAGRHRIRIAAKRLRYMAEFFAGPAIFGPEQKTLKQIIKSCEKLQDALGTIRDEQAMRNFIQSEASKPGEAPGSQTAANRLPAHARSWRSGHKKELEKAQRAYSKLAKMKLF